jgi:opacity protein-like surface antigen
MVRFLGGGFGLEGDVGAGFGNTRTATVPNNLQIKTLFVGGGAHYSLARQSHFEPWLHGLVGLEHVRFTQTTTLGSSNAVGWTLGGGVDLHFNPRTALRGEADYLGSRFGGTAQKHFQLVVGLVFNM